MPDLYLIAGSSSDGLGCFRPWTTYGDFTWILPKVLVHMVEPGQLVRPGWQEY